MTLVPCWRCELLTRPDPHGGQPTCDFCGIELVGRRVRLPRDLRGDLLHARHGGGALVPLPLPAPPKVGASNLVQPQTLAPSEADRWLERQSMPLFADVEPLP